MIVSRVLPTLIKLNCALKLNSIAKTQLMNPAKLSVIKHFPEVVQFVGIRAMSINVEKELNNPKRHFDYEQLIAKKDNENVVIIDVREHSEIVETGKIPGSVHIPLNELNQALNTLSNEEFIKFYGSKKPNKDDEIIFTCRSGRRSLIALKLAEVGKALGEMSEEDFKKQFNAVKPDKNKEVIFSCKAGGRSLKALKLGLELGYKNAGNYKGGWLDWAEKNGLSK